MNNGLLFDLINYLPEELKFSVATVELTIVDWKPCAIVMLVDRKVWPMQPNKGIRFIVVREEDWLTDKMTAYIAVSIP